MNRHKRNRLERELYYDLGQMTAVTVGGIFLVIVFIWNGLSNLLLPLMVGWFSFVLFKTLQPIDRGDSAMWKIIQRGLGIRKINMKLDALARHLRVRFVHVPEHYKCEEVKDE